MKPLIKVLAIALLCTPFQNTLQAQNQSTKHHEVSVNLKSYAGMWYGSSIQSQLAYKVGKSSRAVTRVELGQTRLGVQHYQDSYHLNFSSGLGLGREFRRPINEHFTLTHGPILRADYNSYGIGSKNMSLSGNYLLGLQFHTGSRWCFHIESYSSLSTFQYWSPDVVYAPSFDLDFFGTLGMFGVTFFLDK